jgi:hypothetical protein
MARGRMRAMVKLRLRDAGLVAVLTAAALPALQGAAVARGGHSHGRTAGVATARSVQSAARLGSTRALQGQAPLAASAASTPTSAAPGSTVKSITTLPAPASPPPPTPASAIGAPAPQLQALAPLSPAVTTTTANRGRLGQAGCNGLANALHQQSKRICAEHSRRRRQKLAGLHGVLGQPDAHDEGRVEVGVHALGQ